MSDRKEGLPDFQDVDWDSALDEWEKNSFEPAVAREVPAEPKAEPPAPKAPSVHSEQTIVRASPLAEFEAPEDEVVEIPDDMPMDLDEEPPAPEDARLAPIVEDDESEKATLARAPRRPSFSDAETATRHPADDEMATRHAPEEETATRLPDAPSPPADAPTGELAAADAPTATRLPADDEMPTIGRPSAAPPALGASGYPAGLTHDSVTRPLADIGVSPSKADAFKGRIAWLEAEARASHDPLVQSRGLLAVSELCALVGDASRAFSLAVEARDRAPSLALAWRQTRQLAARVPEVLVDALDAEAQSSPTPAARAHATLLAADVLRVHGSGDAAVERWDSACKLDPADVRAPLARAALALAQESHTSGALKLADNSELVTLDKAVATALRLRGVERAGAEVEEAPINDGLRHARRALADGDPALAAQAIAEIAKVPELASAAHWLSASFGAAHIASRRASARALKTLAEEEPLARRGLAARGIELGDPELVRHALAAGPEPFSDAERVTLGVLANVEVSADGAIGEGALDDALAAMNVDGEERVHRVSGDPDARALTTLGRLLGARAEMGVVDEALGALASHSPAATGVAIASAVHGRRWGELSAALSSLPAGADAGQRHIAAALVAERAGDAERARSAWSSAAQSARAADGLVRIAAEVDPDLDLATELVRLADELPEGPASAALRLEALARSDLSTSAQLALLERVHRASPALGLGASLAERVARKGGDQEEALRWMGERRAVTSDPLERSIDAVREATLVAERDPELAGARLEEAHKARPDDVPLRELWERIAPEPPADHAAWRERRAEKSQGPNAALYWIEAAAEHERRGNAEAFLQAARKAAAAGDRGLSGPMIERGELAYGDTATQTEALIELTKSTDDDVVRREAYERLAEIDAYAAKDTSAANLWHRSILETTPQHKPSLRWLEHAYIGSGRDEDLAPLFEQIALTLAGATPDGGGEVTAHAQHAARLAVREAGEARAGSAWERTRDMAVLAATEREPSLWGLRATNAHARSKPEDELFLTTTKRLLERTQRPFERAALLLRASEAAARLERTDEARALLEEAATEDPADVVTWGFLAELRERAGESHVAAEACEALARTSFVAEHRLLAWHDAAKIWFDEVKDTERAMRALEAAAQIDPSYADVFPRLSALYAERGMDADLASLLERRLATVQDEDERVALEVELARAFAEMSEDDKAKAALESALEKRPAHTPALTALADLCERSNDWAGAEKALVQLARLIGGPDEQRRMYERLAEIYAVHAPNLARAEVAYREVLKRAPGDLETLTKLVGVLERMGDVQKAAAAQQEIVTATVDPDGRLAALVALAGIYENVGKDPRRSEQVLDSARKEFPTSVVALRAMAEFYARQKQMPAMQILLDRAAADARRAFAQGRFVPSLFQVLHAAFELRGKRDAARVVAATLAAVEGQEAELHGADARAVDHRLDDLLAPDLMSPALRNLLFRAGDALDVVAPVDLRALKAAPLPPGTSTGAAVGSIATVVGLGALQILVSPQLGRVALPLATNPATILVGDGLTKTKNERARLFVVVRAIKMLLLHASALIRWTPQDVPVLVAALFRTFNPNYTSHGVDGRRVQDYARKLTAALPKNLDPSIAVIALEAAGMLGVQWPLLAPAAVAWANRVALLAVGDPNAALDAIAWDKGEARAPTGSEERAAWIARHAEARELMTFSVTDTYAEARSRLGLDHE